MRWIPIGKWEGFDLEKLGHYKYVPGLTGTSRGAKLTLWLHGMGQVPIEGDKAETILAFLRSLSDGDDPHAMYPPFPAPGHVEAAEFEHGAARRRLGYTDTIPLAPTAEPGPPPGSPSFEVGTGEIDEAS